MPSPDEIKPDTPLRLGVAAILAFPDGSMTASGLRRESARGRLVIERIAGKDYTTLANIERMRELCRVEAKAPDCGYDQRAEEAARSWPSRSGSFGMATASGRTESTMQATRSECDWLPPVMAMATDQAARAEPQQGSRRPLLR
jgi:hypothetical protein